MDLNLTDEQTLVHGLLIMNGTSIQILYSCVQKFWFALLDHQNVWLNQNRTADVYFQKLLADVAEIFMIFPIEMNARFFFEFKKGMCSVRAKKIPNFDKSYTKT